MAYERPIVFVDRRRSGQRRPSCRLILYIAGRVLDVRPRWLPCTRAAIATI